MTFKSTHRILRALFARFLCLCHIGLSIFVLYSVKKDSLFLIPSIGAILLIAETAIIVVLFKGKEPTSWFSPMFFIYVSTIVGCYWFLELENIKKVLLGSMKREYWINKDDLRGDIVSFLKIVWSQVELQIFFALIMLIRWIIPKSSLSPHGLSSLLFKYFAISCDMLDFLTILQDDKLIKNEILVYFTLSAWSWSTFQYFIFVPKFDDEEKREFTAYITDSLLSAFFLDLPFFGVRIAALFTFGSHNYNSYFFVTKNIVMIILQIIRIKATFSERTIRSNKAARQLKNFNGFDKEPNKLFDPDEIAKKNFLAQRLRNLENIELSEENQSENSLDKLNYPQLKMPRTIETVKANKSLDNLQTIDNQNRYYNEPSRNFQFSRNLDNRKLQRKTDV